jgi:hypothetical protein
LGKTKTWVDYQIKKEEIVNADNLYKLKSDLLSLKDSQYSNFRDFEITYYPNDNFKLDDFDFTFNSSLGTYLLVFNVNDANNTPYIYEYKFKISDINTFAGSLYSNVYTLKGEGINYRWQDKI